GVVAQSNERSEGRSEFSRVGTLIERVANGLSRHAGPVLIILSENDLTAAEFREAMVRSRSLGRVTRRAGTTLIELPEADHTFSTAKWRDRVAAITSQWLLESFPMTTSAHATSDPIPQA